MAERRRSDRRNHHPLTGVVATPTVRAVAETTNLPMQDV
jgi:hypothetical protein